MCTAKIHTRTCKKYALANRNRTDDISITNTTTVECSTNWAIESPCIKKMKFIHYNKLLWCYCLRIKLLHGLFGTSTTLWKHQLCVTGWSLVYYNYHNNNFLLSVEDVLAALCRNSPCQQLLSHVAEKVVDVDYFCTRPAFENGVYDNWRLECIISTWVLSIG